MVIDSKWLNKNGKYNCPDCGKEYSKKGIITHILRSHKKDDRFSNVGTKGKNWKLSKDYVSPRTKRKLEFLNNRVLTECEKCHIIPQEWFGSGRFCSLSCANSNSKTKETKQKISKSNTGKIIKNFTNISFCKHCNKCLKGIKKFCNRKCRSNFHISQYDDLKLYRYYTKFNFSLNDYPNKFDFSLIEKYGWYKAKNRGDNLNGISRDHIVSVRYGFDNNIPTWIIKHPANCQLKPHKENTSKGMNCDLTIDNLLEKIKNW